MPYSTVVANNLTDIFLSSFQKAYNNIRDQVIVPNETSTTDKYKHPIPQFSSGYSAPLQNGGRRDHHQMAGMSNSDYQARDLIVPPSYSSRTGGVMDQRFPQSTQILSPTTHTVPTRTLRRTEVATYRYLLCIHTLICSSLRFNSNNNYNDKLNK